MLTVGMDRSLTSWDLRSPEPTRLIPEAHKTEIGCVAIDGTGTYFASGGSDQVGLGEGGWQTRVC